MMRFPKRAAALVCAVLVLLTSLSAQAAPFSVLLIGVDTAGEAGRSDVMMLASVDPEAGDIRLVSFLRDLYVSIPGHGKDRLNAAYFYGGEALLKRTLEENFGVSVDHTLTAHFPTLVSAVDLMGGLEVDITEAEREQLNKILQDYNRQVGLSQNDGLLERRSPENPECQEPENRGKSRSEIRSAHTFAQRRLGRRI